MAVTGALGVPACFVGYDSRWGEAKRAQQRVAAQSGPAAIAAEADERLAADAAERTWRVRFRSNPHYLSQTIDAPKQMQDLLDDANRVLGPTLGLRLVLDRVQPWSRESEDDLAAVLGALRADDAGEGADLVVGLIGSLPQHTDSFHELGMATTPGRHLVLRAAARADEHDAIDRSFYELSDDDRMRLVRSRKRHRALAIFLHEVGHCLGAQHERDVRSLMNPAYDPKMASFGGGAAALMRATLEGDARTAAGPDASTPDAASSVPAAVPPASQAPPELAPEDAKRFEQARQAFQAGSARAAYDLARPLFASYPRVYAVQDLRCQLATIRWLPREEMLAECAPFNELSSLDAGTAR